MSLSADKAEKPTTATSALAERPLRKTALAASLALHGGVLLALVLIALWATLPPPQAPVLRVALLSEGPGAAGASGGSEGGGPTAAASSAPAVTGSAATPAPSAAPSPAPSPSAAPPQPAAPPDMLAAAAEPPAAAPEPSAAPLPAPPRRKPTPPPPAPPEVAAPLTPAPEQLAAAPPAPGAPGAGSGPGGTAGMGTGAEGAGHGAIGDGPIEGPGDDYLDRLKRWLEKYKRYPEQAKKDKQQGQLVVSFTILRDGTVLDPRIERSSGFPLLDAAALAMLRDASPVPPLPQSYRAPRLGVDLPVGFSLGFFSRVF